MGWLGLSILVSSFIFVIFKWFGKFKVNNLQAIVVNYFIASSLGFVLFGGFPISSILQAKWLWAAIVVGVLFISLFTVMAQVTQQNGVSVASVANKMSVIIPTVLAFFLYQDPLGSYKIIGIAIALVGIFLVTYKGKAKVEGSLWILPLILFVGSGILDSLLKYAQQNLMAEAEYALFTPTAFGIAGILGVFYTLVKKQKWQSKSLLWGVILGVPNYFSILILLMALSIPYIESSVVFPINNVGVVLLSSLFSLVIFKEKLLARNYFGIALSVIAIFLISLEKWG